MLNYYSPKVNKTPKATWIKTPPATVKAPFISDQIEAVNIQADNQLFCRFGGTPL